jgi:hypothetical protein
LNAETLKMQLKQKDLIIYNNTGYQTNCFGEISGLYAVVAIITIFESARYLWI